MPASDVILPTIERSLANVINKHFDRERMRTMAQTTMFRVVWEYLAGARRFDVVDLMTGAVKAYTTDREGKMEFQGSDLLRTIDQIAGYMDSYDLRCKVQTPMNSLRAVREGAVGQVLSNAMFSEDDIRRISPQFLHIFISLGSCGLMAHVEGGPNSMGLSADLEVVHPQELIPFPSIGMDLTKVRGIGREYYMTVTELERKAPKGKKWVRDNLERMYWFKVETGQDPEEVGGGSATAGWWGSEGLNANNTIGIEALKADQEITGYVRLREVWLDGPRGTCTRKVCISGLTVIQDDDYSGLEVYTPIGYARFMENGTWYGAGAYHVMFSTARSLETMNKGLFNEVVDRERYGYLVVPQGSYQVNQTLRDVGKGLRVLGLEPDSMTDSGMRPFIVQPNQVGDSWTKAAVYAKQYYDALSPLTDVIREKGRVDSQSGLAFLQEQADRAMTSPTRGVVRAFGQMYKAAIAKGAQLVTENPGQLPVGSLTLDLAGVVIDWENEVVKFPENPLPTMSRLTCRPAMAGARSVAQRKLEALELVKVGIGSPTQLLMKSIEEGWDLPLWLGVQESAQATIVRNLLTLYNDGITPGELEENKHFVRPEIQLMWLDSFMGSIKMKVASVDVKDEFIAYREFLIGETGRTLPDAMPFNPDDLAAGMQGQQAAVQALPPQMMGS